MGKKRDKAKDRADSKKIAASPLISPKIDAAGSNPSDLELTTPSIEVDESRPVKETVLSFEAMSVKEKVEAALRPSPQKKDTATAVAEQVDAITGGKSHKEVIPTILSSQLVSDKASDVSGSLNPPHDPKTIKIIIM